MPTKTFAVQAGGPPRVEISWRGIWKDVRVTFDRLEVLRFADQKALRTGGSASLPDGSTLEVRLGTTMGGLGPPELQLSLDGAPLPGSSGDAQTHITGAVVALYLIAGVSIGVGLLTVMFEIEFLAKAGFGAASILGGVIYGILGFLTQQRHSLVALGIATVLFALDTLWIVYVPMSQQAAPPVGALFVRIMLIFAMGRGFFAILSTRNAAPVPPVRMPRPAATTPSAGAAIVAGPAPQITHGIPSVSPGTGQLSHAPTPQALAVQSSFSGGVERVQQSRALIANVGDEGQLAGLADQDARQYGLYYPQTLRRKGLLLRELVERLGNEKIDMLHLLATCDDRGRLREPGFVISLRELLEKCRDSNVRLVWLAAGVDGALLTDRVWTGGTSRMHVLLTRSRGREFPLVVSWLLSRTSGGKPLTRAFEEVASRGADSEIHSIFGRSDVILLPS